MDTFGLPNVDGERISWAKPAAQDVGRRSVCLLTALTIADFVDPELTAGARINTGAQLGVLTLAAILRESNFDVQVLNLDELFLAFLKTRKKVRLTGGTSEPAEPAADTPSRDTPTSAGPESFFGYVAEHLKALSFDICGLSSICSSYPLTLRLAAEAKRFNPDSWIVLGGPQASVVDVATLRTFPYVDFIVRGEADETAPRLFHLISRNTAGGWEDLAGITFRRGDQVIRSANAPVVHDLDGIPLPAFDLDAEIRNRDGIHLEIGRGCPFACSFCSTNDFFRRNFRLKSAWKTVEEMQSLKQQYGFTYFSFVHDMYTIDRKKVVAFCQALLELDEKFAWGCSARTDCVDDELIGLMAAAGCRGIFFGVETGSDRMQQVIHKRLDLAESRKRIACADRHGIDMAVAFIIGFPEETRDDLRDTIHFFVDSLRYDHAEPQISLLAPLAATPIHERFKDQLIFDRIFSDMSHQGWHQDAADLELIERYPEIFPNFYAIPLSSLDRGYLKELIDFVTYLVTWFRWLPVVLLRDSGDFLEVFDRWRGWLAERKNAEGDEDIGRVPYYSHRRFRKEFLEFVRGPYLEEMATARVAVETISRAEDLPQGVDRTSTAQPGSDAEQITEACVPYLPERARVFDVDIDYRALVECLRDGRAIGDIAQARSTIVYRPSENKQIQVWQLAPLSAKLLHLCDGRKTVRDIIGEFALGETDIDGIPAEKVGMFGLMQLRQQGFLGLANEPAETQASNPHDDIDVAPAARIGGTQKPWPPLGGLQTRQLLSQKSDALPGS